MADPVEQAPKSGRGGKRPGAGRKRKEAVPPARLAGIDLAAALEGEVPQDITELAQGKAWAALDAFVKQLMHGQSEAAQVVAANAILDRGFGKPAVDVGGDAMLPFMTKPAAEDLGAQLRTKARIYARLAIEVLNKIATSGASESARMSAGKSLWDRGLGTVAQAKLPDSLHETQRPMGKKEELVRAASAAATGRYAVPAPPARTVN